MSHYNYIMDIAAKCESNSDWTCSTTKLNAQGILRNLGLPTDPTQMKAFMAGLELGYEYGLITWDDERSVRYDTQI